MTREELRTNQEYMWQALSGEQSMTLTLAVEMLLRCHLSPNQILTKTMTALEGLPRFLKDNPSVERGRLRRGVSKTAPSVDQGCSCPDRRSGDL